MGQGTARAAVRTRLLATTLCVLATATVAAAVPAAARVVDPARTFEHDAVGAVPTGCRTPSTSAPAIVSDVRGNHSRRSLRLEDQSTTAITEIQCPVAAQPGGVFAFHVYPAQLTNGFTFSLLGHLQGIPDEQPVFDLDVDSDGAIQWWDHGGWTQVAGRDTVRRDRWTTVRVQVPDDMTRSHVFVDGSYVGDGGPVGVRPVADVSGYQFASWGTATAGDDVFVDDVRLRSAVNRRAPVHQTFGVGRDVTVATSATPVQMPNTAVNVTVDGRRQTLVSYPAHTDASDTAGNRMAVSTDGGRTWNDAQARNPMPDAPSYDMTTLANGDVLAVDYHTYMVSGSGNRQATVPTAISHDGGRTWSARNGIMTTPQAMRNISSVTDRPGEPLGGFVLVHNVVEDPDGTLYQSGYGYYADDPKYRQIVLKSTDEGANWSVAATVAYNPTLSSDPRYEGFDEGALARTGDGALLIVMRTGSYQQMYTSRSTDDGTTWSTPQPLVAGHPATPVVGIYPTLARVAGGRLVLWIGRPGQSMLRSTDANGTGWTRPQQIDYANSGNGTVVVLDPSHLLAFGDRGADWSYPTPTTYRVWSRKLTLNP